MKQKMLNTVTRFGSLALASAMVLSACGPQAFVPSSVSSQQTAAGDQNIPPKVDILLGVSTNGTMGNIFPQLAPEISTFVKGLQASGWDYHFVSIPLNERTPAYSAALKVSVSNYDTNYTAQGSWLSPFPGASSSDPSLGILPSLFSQSFLIPIGVLSGTNDAHETGLQNELSFLQRTDVSQIGAFGQTSFLRPDAVLAVITLSNGDDRSLSANINGATVNMGDWNTVAWNGNQYTPNDLNYAGDFANGFIGIKGSSLLTKYYALVAHNTLTCRGYADWAGNRYEAAAAALNGKSIDICTTPLASALSSVSADLTTQKLSFEKRFLVIGSEPNVSTIKVTKISGGTSTELVKDDPNGWSYAGYLTNQPTIDAPLAMANATGYMIELHGTGKLHGADTAKVDFMNAGAVSSH